MKRHTRARKITSIRTRAPWFALLRVARSGNLGSKKEFQDGGRQASRWFYRVSSISKVCSHCLFELQSSIVLFFDVLLVFWKLTYFFLGVSTLFMILHILYFIRIRN